MQNCSATFNKIDGWRDSVWIHGTHDVHLPFLGRLFSSNVSKWACFNGDAFFLRCIEEKNGWRYYKWLHHRSINPEWMRSIGLDQLLSKIIGVIESSGHVESAIRFYSNSKVSLQIYDFDSNISTFSRMFDRGDFDFRRSSESEKD